jgi:DENN (AEX-3) domain
MISNNDQQSYGDSGRRDQERSDSHNDSMMQEEDENEVQMYIPIAFVLQTEVEYHDIFRELALDLFESIRKTPDNPKGKNGEEIKLSF